MEKWQFDKIIEKLEEIRCGIIDVETAAQNIKVGLPSASQNTARDEIAAAVRDLVAYLDGGASVRPDDDWHKRLRQLRAGA